jgi:hypothetical protein
MRFLAFFLLKIQKVNYLIINTETPSHIFCKMIAFLLRLLYFALMQARKITLKNVNLGFQQGYFPLIGKYIPGVLKESDLPKPVILVDEDTNEEFNFSLKTLVPFKDAIPEVFSIIATGKDPEDSLEELLMKNKAESVNQLAFYLYVR